ncbi:viperin family antiviral radical SAM protein [Chondromyces crocatus]|uniref:S-adenosylmethionine-dependent nucleotide dehydratase n=1 Tax=Chondromyces crocatus TaxID=52 RepID=A0A0K1EKA3_CHOCO|nr:viperin family antiviral radical SAM protein [Chondromyces crocatus]AKT41092.1 uncharacterized protein CMC5_052510 [Chondromyces crocatus]
MTKSKGRALLQMMPSTGWDGLDVEHEMVLLGRGSEGGRVHPLPRSVNYHLWKPCNMRCTFCFATFDDMGAGLLPKGHLLQDDAIAVVATLARRFEKITFAGGEPTLCPWLVELMEVAKRAGAVTMLVTNGSRLTPEYLGRLQGKLDWLTLSIDSASEKTHALLGRAVKGAAMATERYVEVVGNARALGMRIKVNTVVTTLNAGEKMSELLLALRPERWKILQALPVEGQNSGRIEPLVCSKEAFAAFVKRHRHLEGQGMVLVPEDHEAITGSYAMVDPAGRFFDDITGQHRYSKPILDVGLEQAWSQVGFLPQRFEARGGDYEF